MHSENVDATFISGSILSVKTSGLFNSEFLKQLKTISEAEKQKHSYRLSVIKNLCVLVAEKNY
jgi:hypothetical protein